MNQNRTPLLDAIVEYTKERPVYFKIPGHRYEKGISERWKQWTGDGIFRFDLTEAEGLDDLHCPEGVIKEAQELTAEVFGAKKTWFLVNGTTCGNEAMIMTCAREGEKIMVARNAHKSALMGLILSGAVPVWLMPKQEEKTGLCGCVTPEAVEAGFQEHPDCKGVFLVSPTYYGVCSDLKKIADICHAHNAMLLVDEAHGGHLYFGDEKENTDGLPQGAIQLGADMCAQSMHKVTGSLTQSSLLHVGSGRVDVGQLTENLHLVQSTSPSYLLMTSLDAARYELAKHGKEMLGRALRLAETARAAINRIPGMYCVGEEAVGEEIYQYDLTRLVITAEKLGLSGYGLGNLLYEKYKVGMELADDKYVVAVVTYANEEEDILRLTEALEDIGGKALPDINRKELENVIKKACQQKIKESVGICENDRFETSDVKTMQTEISECMNSRQSAEEDRIWQTEMVYTPRQAYQAQKKTIAWKDAVGKIAGEALIPYPPGIPLVNPGERISKEIWEYMETYRQKGLHFHGPADKQLQIYKIIPEKA